MFNVHTVGIVVQADRKGLGPALDNTLRGPI